MKKGDIVTYTDIKNQDFALQRGMYFRPLNKPYGIIIMRRDNKALYTDNFTNNDNTLFYEGHDIQANYNYTKQPAKLIDQPQYTPKGNLTENGKFYESVQLYKNGKPARKIKVYEKIKKNTYIYHDFFLLTDAYIEYDGNRNIFKFKLEAINHHV